MAKYVVEHIQDIRLKKVPNHVVENIKTTHHLIYFLGIARLAALLFETIFVIESLIFNGRLECLII